MCDDYVICIPTYRRANICKTKTLTMLLDNGIPACKINVYVANDEEYAIYNDVIPKTMYNKLIVGEIGLVNQREFISKQFEDGQCILFIDDDVGEFDLSLSDEFKKCSLDEFISIAFLECAKKGSYIWGVYPVYNPFFRKSRKEKTFGLNYIVGAFYGIINRPLLDDVKLTLTTQSGQKEDVERTIKYFICDGKVIRYNKIGFKTKYYGGTGGLGKFNDRIVPMKIACEKLLEEYPEFGKIKIRKSGMYEFVLKGCKALEEEID